MEASFKTCLFGGFDREDVVAYIEKTAAENQSRLEALQAENDELCRERDALAAESEGLRQLTEEAARVTDENEALREQLEALRTEVAALRTENETLRQPAAEYLSLKEHIADIEITAHRRTEEFRARAVEYLTQCIAQQRAWCNQRRSSYLATTAALLEQLRHAEETLENADYTGFDNMLMELQQLEEALRQGNGEA